MLAVAVVATVVALATYTPSHAASPDGNVEWAGVSHVAWQDRRPLCPVDGESFLVQFQTWANDITSARVRVDDGSVAWVSASAVATRGPYDVWAAVVPATVAMQLDYVLELTDGADVDYLGPDGMSDALPVDRFELDFATLVHAPVGATLTSDGGAVFRVWAPTRATVSVPGEFNAWTTGADFLTKVGGHFIGRVPNVSARQMYKYHFNGTHWNSDARARGLNPGNNYNAYVEDPLGYTWQVEDFATPPLEEMVIYQLHVGTFAGRNDPVGSAPYPSRYADVEARVAHLAELGINAVMLNPVTEFAGDISAGYNPVSNWAPEWKYGTPNAFKGMVDTFHQHGIAVLLDIVWNHQSVSDNWLWFYDGTQTYFDDPAVDTPWGAQADFDEPEVQDYYLQSAMSWLEEYRVDGFRMDATDFMNLPAQEAAGWNLMQRLNDVVDNRYANKVVIAEQLPDDEWVTRPTSLGGAGFDSQYYDNFTDRLREEILDAAFGDPEMWKIRDIVNGSLTYLRGRYVTNYVELHDEAWPTSGGQRIVKTIDTTAPHDDEYATGRFKLAQGLTLLAPGVPAFLQGSEWLESTDFGTDLGNRIDWSKKVTYGGIFRYFQDLVALRTGSQALRADASRYVFHVNESGNVVGFERNDGNGGVFVVVANFSNTDYPNGYRIGLPLPGGWSEVLNSQAAAYMGHDLVNASLLTAESVPDDGFAQSAEIVLPRMGIVVLRHTGSLTAAPGPVRATAFGLRAVPNPARAETVFELSLDAPRQVRLEVFDVRGRRVSTLLDAPLDAGVHTLGWSTGGVARGVYFARLDAGDRSRTRKVLLVD